MTQTFTKVAGVAQTAIGLLGQFVPAAGSMMGAAGSGGNVFNVLSGAALSYLGFKGSDSNQRMGAQAIGGLNAIVGLLSAFGITNIAGIQLNQGMVSTIVNLLIGAWGLYAGFAKKPAGAPAH